MIAIISRAADAAATGPSDDDDLDLFAPSPRHEELADAILRVKRDDPAIKCLRLNNVDYSDEAWTRLGEIVGRSEHLEELNVCHGDPDVAGLCAGLRNNRSIRRLDFLGVDLYDADELLSLAPFLKGNPNLRDLTLAACGLGPVGLNSLSSAISNSRSLERLNLCCNHFGDVELDCLVESLSGNRRLTSLRLSGCGIGRRGCASLAKLLGDPTSELAELRLNLNCIDDDCAVVLADSLSDNAKLEELHLNGNLCPSGKDGITSRGWSAFLKLVGDCSSVDGVMGSNHALCHLGMTNADLAKTVGRALSAEDANLLCASLEMNESKNKTMVVRRKMIRSHARRNINLGESSIHTGAVPRLLALVGGGPNETVAEALRRRGPPLPNGRNCAIGLDSIYRVVSSVPELCDARANSAGGCRERKDEGNQLADALTASTLLFQRQEFENFAGGCQGEHAHRRSHSEREDDGNYLADALTASTLPFRRREVANFSGECQREHAHRRSNSEPKHKDDGNQLADALMLQYLGEL